MAAGQEENCRPLPKERERNGRVVFWNLETERLWASSSLAWSGVGEQQLSKRKHNMPTEKLSDPKGSTPVCPVTYAQVKTESALLCSFSATPPGVGGNRHSALCFHLDQMTSQETPVTGVLPDFFPTAQLRRQNLVACWPCPAAPPAHWLFLDRIRLGAESVGVTRRIN